MKSVRMSIDRSGNAVYEVRSIIVILGFDYNSSFLYIYTHKMRIIDDRIHTLASSDE